MKTRILLALVLLLTATFALGQTAPACNGVDATTGALVYFAPGSTTGSPACTDYFGKANYANSPLPVGPVDTSLTGFTIVDGGKGYSATPSVTVTDFYGVTPTIITCTATMSVGRIIGITGCSASTPDFMAPVVNITDATQWTRLIWGRGLIRMASRTFRTAPRCIFTAARLRGSAMERRTSGLLRQEIGKCRPSHRQILRRTTLTEASALGRFPTCGLTRTWRAASLLFPELGKIKFGRPLTPAILDSPPRPML